MDKKILEAALNGLATNSTRLQDETSRKTDLPISWVSALFKKLQARYGHKWTSAIDGIEDIATHEWSQRLGGLTGEQIKKGWDEWDKDWPPSADEFKNTCLGKSGGLNEYGLDYVPTYYRQMDKSRLLSSDARELSREESRLKIKKLKEMLNAPRETIQEQETESSPSCTEAQEKTIDTGDN